MIELNTLKISEVMGDFVIIKPLAAEDAKSASGLVVISLKLPILDRGEVVGAGPGHYEGERFVRNPFSVGEKVIYHKSAPYEIEEDGQKFFILKPHDIFAKLG